MGEPVKIVDLAQQMIRLAGLRPGRDIGIEFIGLRPGEKLHEEKLSIDMRRDRRAIRRSRPPAQLSLPGSSSEPPVLSMLQFTSLFTEAAIRTGRGRAVIGFVGSAIGVGECDRRHPRWETRGGTPRPAKGGDPGDASGRSGRTRHFSLPDRPRAASKDILPVVEIMRCLITETEAAEPRQFLVDCFILLP